jgi:hypothetical protein
MKNRGSRVAGLVVISGLLSAVCALADVVPNGTFYLGLEAPFGPTPSYTFVIDPFWANFSGLGSGANCVNPIFCGSYDIGNYDGHSSIPYWTVNQEAGLFTPGVGYTIPISTTPPGGYYAFAEAGGVIGQNEGTIVNGQKYVLTVEVLSPNDVNIGLGAPNPFVDLYANGSKVDSLVAGGAVTGLTEGVFTLDTVTFTGNAATAGEILSIEMGDSSGGIAMFSDVTLTPEPSFFIPAGIGFAVLMAVILRRRALARSN